MINKTEAYWRKEEKESLARRETDNVGEGGKPYVWSSPGDCCWCMWE